MTDKKKEVEYAYPDMYSLMSNEEMWNTLLSQVDSYKDEIEKCIAYSVPYHEALFAYHENIFTPLMYELDSILVRMAVMNMPKGHIYLEISKYWFELMKEDNNVFAGTAVSDYISKYRMNWFTRLIMKNDAGNKPHRFRKHAA